MEDQKDTVKTVKKAKGTKVTEGIIGAASSKIVMATKHLRDASVEALRLVDTLDENALKIADQEEKLSGLKTEFDNKRGQMKIDLDLSYQADRKAFADKYLTDNKLVSVEAGKLDEMSHYLTDWELKFAEKVSAEVGKAKGMAESQLKTSQQLAEAQYLAREAQNLARIENLQAQLTFSNQQVEIWKGQLNSERQASIERSKGQSATVNVASPGK